MRILAEGFLPPACGHVWLHRLLAPLFASPCLGCSRPEGDPLCPDCLAEGAAFPLESCESCMGRLLRGRCALCDQPDVPIEQVYALGSYQGSFRTLIRRLKYHMRPDLGYWLGDRLAALLEPCVQSHWIVVPVPIHQARRRERGYNQTEPMAYQIAKRLRLAYRPDILQRRFQSRPSYQKGRADRWAHASHVFAANAAVRGENILLVDDIMTTGATAWEAAMTLKGSGARSIRLAVAARAT